MRYILLIFLSFNVLSEPWLYASDSSNISYINDQLKACNDWDESFVSFPISYGEINFYLEKINVKNINSTACKNNIESIKIYLRDQFIQTRKVIIGFQSGTNDEYFQTRRSRYFRSANYHFSVSDINSNIAYKIKIINSYKENKNYFDESYISYKYKNHIFTAGRVNRWWSPSESYSLILSNSARPALGIEYKNYKPIKFQNSILKFLGYVNYEFFINKLEKERVIPNTLLFGNRVTLKLFDSFKFSFLRLAQFGGKNRPTDPSTILKMLVGKDNASSNLSIDAQPGNQLAGFDFIYKPRNTNFKIYGQTIGEDEAGYFPSRKMSLFGIAYHLNDFNSTKLNIDFIDTYAGIKNISYNHFLYKSGLRYYGIPIGASIDADSEALKFSLHKKYNDLDFEFSLSDIHLNKNNSLLNYWTKESADFNQIELMMKYHYKNSYIDLIYTLRDKKFNNFSKNNVVISLNVKF